MLCWSVVICRVKMPRFILQNFQLCFAEIYSKVGKNAILQAKPSVIHFSGFELGKKITRTLVSFMLSLSNIGVYEVWKRLKLTKVFKYQLLMRFLQIDENFYITTDFRC